MILFLALIASIPAAPSAQAGEDIRLQSLRMGVQDARTTRIVVDLTQAPPYRVFPLADPARVVIDLPDVGWNPNLAQAGKGAGSVKAYRFGRFRPGMTRIVLDMGSPVRIASLFRIPGKSGGPHRLVLDLERVDDDVFRASVRKKPRMSEGASALFSPERPEGPKEGPKERKDPRRIRPMVMIDAGHGGVDPGALAGSDLKEKSITLRAARILRDTLLASGRYDVRLTRDSDRFLSLRHRITLARRAGADLFLSLHADSHSRKRVRGFAVYTLSEHSSDREAAALAARENQSDVIAGIDLSDESREVRSILIDLTQRETMNLSVNLATSIIARVGKKHRLLGRSHRFAGFAVLKAPDIPSILIELGYLSNPTDRRNLRSKAFLRKLCAAILKGIDDYFQGTLITQKGPS